MGGVSITGVNMAGGIIQPKQTWFQVEGNPVSIVGCEVMPHGPGLHLKPTMAEGAGFFTIDGIPICREGHKATCGHATNGQGWFDVE